MADDSTTYNQRPTRMRTLALAAFGLAWLATGASTAPQRGVPQTASPLVELWASGVPAFGVFVPSEQPRRDADGNRLPPLYTREGAEQLARNPLLDYLFLNLDSAYDGAAIDALVAGLATVDATRRPTLLVRIPPIEQDGEPAARERVHDALARGAGGIVLPHIRSPAEASVAVRFFEEAGADVWSPAHPDGHIIAMLMIEDPDALEAVQAIADTPGYSLLSCGIGSLTGALGGDRDAGEAGAEVVLGHATRNGMPSMMTANRNNLSRRIEQGYLGILLQMGDDTADLIQVGRTAAGR